MRTAKRLTSGSLVKRAGKSTWNSEKLTCGASLKIKTTMWLRKLAGSLESGSDGPHHLVSPGNRVVQRRAIPRVPLADWWKSELVDAVWATRWPNPALVAGAAPPPPGTCRTSSRCSSQARAQKCQYTC